MNLISPGSPKNVCLEGQETVPFFLGKRACSEYEGPLAGNKLHYLVDPATYKAMKNTTKVSSDAGAIALSSDPYTNFNTGTVGVRAMLPIDLAVRHAVSFAKSSA